MKTITVMGIDKEIAEALDRESRRTGRSVNSTILVL